MKNAIQVLVSSTPATGLRLAALAASLVWLAGCSSLPQTVGTQLRDAQELAVEPGNENARSYRAAAGLATYGNIRIDAVRFAADAGEMTPEQQGKIGDRLAAALRAAVGGRQAGAGEEVVVTATVVKVALGNPGANVPAAALLGLGVDMGGVVVELEARGARTGARVAAARYVEAGKPWQFTANFSAIGHAVKGAEKAAERFGLLLASK